MSTAAAEIQLDLFGAPELETRPCGTCGGKGSYNVIATQFSGNSAESKMVSRSCSDCRGHGYRTVTAKPDCPQSAKSAGTELGSVAAMTDFSRAMKASGYGLKVTVGGDLDIRKAKRACNALLHNAASDKPEPKVTDWESATDEVYAVMGPDDPVLRLLEDDPDPGACARRVAAVEVAAAAEKARAKK